MQKFSRRGLRGGASRALFAMLAVLCSPALAFACCCAPQIVSVPASPAPVASLPASHPGCHGHAETDEVKTPTASAVRASAPTSHATPRVAATSSQPCFKSLCECGHAQDSAVSFVETSSASSFTPLVLGVAARRFSPALISLSSVHFAFASNVARPRGPDVCSRSGRAPPALSL